MFRPDGVCQEPSGTCATTPKIDGLGCDDGIRCTLNVTCQAGVCSGANPVTCGTPDQCHTTGMCDPNTGTCTNPPKANGSACSDGNACTRTDACQAGVCTGLDPISAHLLDELIIELKNSLGATVVVVTHELASIFAIGDNSIFLDPQSHTISANGNPKDLLEHCDNPIVHRFLSRGEAPSSDGASGEGNRDAIEKAPSSSVRSNG